LAECTSGKIFFDFITVLEANIGSHRSRNTTTRDVVAVKVIDIDESDYRAHGEEKDEQIRAFQKEIKILRQAQESGAPNLNQMIEALPVHSQLWLVCEYCPGGSVKTLVSLYLYFHVLYSLLACDFVVASSCKPRLRVPRTSIRVLSIEKILGRIKDFGHEVFARDEVMLAASSPKLAPQNFILCKAYAIRGITMIAVLLIARGAVAFLDFCCVCHFCLGRRLVEVLMHSCWFLLLKWGQREW
jgi:serine/threonine protein kinase